MTATTISQPRKETVTKRSLRSAKKSLAMRSTNQQQPEVTVSCQAMGKRPRVNFSANVATRHFTANTDDLQESWYTGNDYARFEDDCSNTISAIRTAFSRRQKGNNKAEYRLDPKEFTAKGLEDLLSMELKRHRGFLKGRHHHHVLMEHQMQRSHGIVDMDQLAAVSQMFSSENSHIALERGNTKDY